MKYAIRQTARHKKSLKRMIRRGKDIEKIVSVVSLLAKGEPLPPQCKDHALVGDLAGLRDCHVENDWGLLYQIKNDLLILILADTGTHSDHAARARHDLAKQVPQFTESSAPLQDRSGWKVASPK